jgi:hypothetical protein
MTGERRKSILILIGTLIIGILLGLLVPGFFYKMNRKRNGQFNGRPQQEMNRKGDWFAATINRIVQPDSTQAKQIRIITDNASVKIDSIESGANLRMSEVLDSVKIQLKPVLNDDQWKRLEEFDAKAKSNWHSGKGGHRHRN